MRDRLLRYIGEHQLFDREDKVVVGVSAGRDSVCLLHLLYEIRHIYALDLLVFHVNHGIRGAEADRDEDFVRDLADRLGLPFFGVKKDVPAMAAGRGMSEEEAGRCARYEAMEACCESQGADRIAIAHHRGDQAETVLFHMFRGSGPRGLAGMPVKRGRIVRPLLFAEREDIDRYIEERGLDFREDRSNASAKYSRNKIRLELLPYVEANINPRAGRHIAQAAEQIGIWRDTIERLGQQAFERHVTQHGDCLRLDLAGYGREERAVQGEVLRRIFRCMIPGAKDIGKYHYDRVAMLSESGTGKTVDLPCRCRARREYGEIVFSREPETPGEPDGGCLWIECHPPCRHIVDCGGEKYYLGMEIKKRGDLPEEIPEKVFSKWFDYDKINNGLVIRNPAPGDYFILNARGGRKKLARHYVDCKLPRGERGRQIVLAEGAHVLWAFPDRTSAAFLVSENTKNILVVTKERIRS